MQYKHKTKINMNDTTFTTKLESPEVSIVVGSDGKKTLAEMSSIINDVKEIDNYDITAFCDIDWELYAEIRSWGLKNISLYATNVFAEIYITWWGEDWTSSGGDKEEKITIDASEDEWEVETCSEYCDIRGGASPTNVDIDFETKTILVSFNND